MKKILLVAALVATTGMTAEAQTNRTYYSDMQTKQMYQNERQSGSVNTNTTQLSLGSETSAQQQQQGYLQMNSVQQHQGYRVNDAQQYYGNSPAVNDRHIRTYDTSKNNGTCIGCGSGAITDHRKDLMGRELK